MNKPVNLSITKLLKEKGFDLPVLNFYNEEGGFHQVYNMAIPENMNKVNTSEWYKHSIMYSAPSISEVIMWLYDKYGIWITSTHVRNKFRYEIIKKDGVVDHSSFDFNSPKETYEVAIDYVLKKIV